MLIRSIKPTAIAVLIAASMSFGDATSPATQPGLIDAYHLRTIGLALNIYAAAHDSRFPRTLGETLPYLSLCVQTPTEQATMFLSPGDKRNAVVPKELTTAWIDANTSYIYLGSADLKVTQIPEADKHTVLLAYVDLDQQKPEIKASLAQQSGVTVEGVAYTYPLDKMKQMIADSKDKLSKYGK